MASTIKETIPKSTHFTDATQLIQIPSLVMLVVKVLICRLPSLVTASHT